MTTLIVMLKSKPQAIRFEKATFEFKDGKMLVTHVANGKRRLAEIPAQDIVLHEVDAQ